ncbi:hypothetical protein GE061_007266 [Apolygus lucorum]|uniref:Peptidase S1 domain-containing protein n=1 Tax=Apolygus lucorum TaxID=248454 RepID=A0A8S9WT01_APOLU|nr:hypothetical protein GE061_007266 [Apolygus lucorum]
MTNQVIFVLALVSLVTGSPRFRPKRIIEGSEMIMSFRDVGIGYDEMRYSVWIGRGEIHVENYPAPRADSTLMKCGGVLLTPTIVQTSCHCVADFVVHNRQEGDRAEPKHNFVDRYEIFFGEVYVYNMYYYSLAKQYIIYERCLRYYFTFPSGDKRGAKEAHFLHDYGLIVMERSTTEGENLYEPVSFAPMSTVDDMISFYLEAMEKQYMCLFFGYGHLEESDAADPPNHIRMVYGWRHLLRYRDCERVSYSDNYEMRSDMDPAHSNATFRKYFFYYHTDAEWACLISLRPQTHPRYHATTSADSGGPVTCNGEFFAHIGESFLVAIDASRYIPYDDRIITTLVLVNPIVHTMFSTAVEFREAFQKRVSESVQNSRVNPPPIETAITYNPPTEESWRYDYKKNYFSATFAQSSKVGASIHFILTLFLLTLLP